MPPTKKPTTADLLTLIAERGPALRAAGVRSFTIDGFSVELGPAEPAQAEQDDNPPAPVITDPLDDPDTFGGFMPRTRPDRDD